MVHSIVAGALKNTNNQRLDYVSRISQVEIEYHKNVGAVSVRTSIKTKNYLEKCRDRFPKSSGGDFQTQQVAIEAIS